MIDKESRSLWSHLLGAAMHGPLEGKSLESVPSTMTDWATWSSRHPDTTAAILRKTANHYRRRIHQQANVLLIGLSQGEETRAWPFMYLREEPIVNGQVGNRSVLVCYDHDGGTAVIFDRELDGQLLTFSEQAGQLTDRETGTSWDRVTGEGVSGPLASKTLEQAPGIVSLHEAWARFHPASTYWLGTGATQTP